MSRWYVVHTQANGEERARANLERQGFEVYLPRYLKHRRHARRTGPVRRPLFPCYLFVRFDRARTPWILQRSGSRPRTREIRHEIRHEIKPPPEDRAEITLRSG